MFNGDLKQAKDGLNEYINLDKYGFLMIRIL